MHLGFHSVDGSEAPSIREMERKPLRDVVQKSEYPSATPLCHIYPTRSKQSAQYGQPRILPDGSRYFHTGLDLRARVGHPIFASAPGKVVFVEKQTVPGLVVVVDHGMEIFSKYFHLSEAKVSVGDIVSSNSIVGLGTGSTTAYAIERLGDRIKSGDLTNIKGIPTSFQASVLAN